MAKTIVLDERINELLKEFRRRSVENHLRNTSFAFNEQEIVEALARRASELGPAGIQDLRRVLLPESESDTGLAEGAARALAELEDGDALSLIIYQAAKLWDDCAKIGGRIGSGRTFGSFLGAARKLMPGTLKKGPLHEGVIKTLTLFVQYIDDWRAYYSVFETAACTGCPVLRDELVKIIIDRVSDDWYRRADALFALRHFSEMQATMLEAINHSHERFSRRAADALVEMLGIIPGCGERDYVRWKTWAMEHVPPN